MANIPILKENVSAQAVTATVDRSGVLKEEQRGISEFNQFLQSTIKQGAQIYDSKVYASDSTKGQQELLGFMDETKNDKIKADYFKENKGNMAGYATFRAKKNMEVMERRLSTITHPKARKELEKQMAFQAQKSLLSDMGDENRIIQGLTQEKETVKNQVLAAQVVEMKSPSQQDQYEIIVNQRLADIQEATNSGLIDPVKAVKMRESVLDDSANLRARALVEGGDSLSAMKSLKTNRFGTMSQLNSTRNYIISKHLDGAKEGYQQLKLQNDLKREQNEARTYEIDNAVQTVVNDPSLSEAEKLSKTRALQLQYQGALNTKQARILNNATYEVARNSMSNILANVNSIPYDETDTATFKGAVASLRAISANPLAPSKIRKEASNALNSVIKKQKVHEALVEKRAYDPLMKGNLIDKLNHKKIINRLEEEPKYESLPVEGKVAVYKLFAEGKDRRFISVVDKAIKGPGDDPFVMQGEKALEIYRKKPEIFDTLLRRMIKRRKPSLSTTGVERIAKDFKTSFDDYRDKVDNFETQEKAILDKYSKGLK